MHYLASYPNLNHHNYLPNFNPNHNSNLNLIVTWTLNPSLIHEKAVWAHVDKTEVPVSDMSPQALVCIQF